ncbi:transglutaminase [Streptococcus panodentis]|uniref:Transglutaminase n=1 Tax=Streptococcus panodentis TaxID=1581472 RepID=A0ABS5AYA1_9STRE|nr:transglutaminase [Streptococcus panodentis]
MEEYLKETALLDFSHPFIQDLIERQAWRNMAEFDRLKAIYDFVRNDILFGYNESDGIPASKILSDGFGQCNTKGILFMALLRGCGIPCRMHGFTIDKQLQKGAMTGFVYRNAPQEILHSWVEVYFEEIWYELEGFILDDGYLKRLQNTFPDCRGAFCGYGAATAYFQHPKVAFNRSNTYIQSEGIVQDLGAYPSPDEFFLRHRQELSAVKEWLYCHLGRHLMNRNIRKIRGKG